MTKIKAILLLIFCTILVSCGVNNRVSSNTTISNLDTPSLSKEPSQVSLNEGTLPTIKTEFSLVGTVIDKGMYSSEVTTGSYYYVTVIVYDTDHHSPYTFSVDENQFNDIIQDKKYSIDFYYIFAPTEESHFRIEASVINYKVFS